MDDLASIESIFSNSRLTLSLPLDSAIGPSRSDVFFDEVLRFQVHLHLPRDLPWTLDETQVLLGSPAVTVTAETGFVEEVNSAATRKNWTGLGVSDIAQPLTPAPVPGLAAGSEAYATVAPASTSQVTFDKRKDKLRVEEVDGAQRATFAMTCNVAYPAKPLSSPMFIVTATISLRAVGLADLLPKPVKAVEPAGEKVNDAKARAARRKDEEYAFSGSEEINLFAPLAADPLFNNIEAYLPSSRLPSSILRANFSGTDTRTHASRPSLASHTRSQSQDKPDSLPALRRSIRGVYQARPALFVRVRAVETGPLLCIELENNVECRTPFEVTRLDIDAALFAVRSFPFVVKPHEQINLIYKARLPSEATERAEKQAMATPIAATMSPSRSFSRRPMPGWAPSNEQERPRATEGTFAVMVHGRPLQTEGGRTTPLTEVYASRWTSSLDLRDLTARAAGNSVNGQNMRLSLTAAPQAGRKVERSSGPIAGSRRHTAANLASLANTPHPSSIPALAAPTPILTGDSPRRPASALAAPSFGRRFFSTPTPASPSTPIPETPVAPSTTLTVPETPSTAVPPTPAYPPYIGAPPSQPSYFAQQPIPEPVEERTLIVSIALQPLSEDGKIRPLDTFLVDVFMANRSERVRRFTIGVPSRKARSWSSSRRGKREGEAASREERLERYAAVKASKATLLPLENHVRIGPLLPDTVQSVRMRFIALQPGVHTIDELQLVEVGPGTETRLRNVLTVVIDQPILVPQPQEEGDSSLTAY